MDLQRIPVGYFGNLSNPFIIKLLSNLSVKFSHLIIISKYF